MKNWLEYLENSFVKQPDGSVSLSVRACKWLNANRIDKIIEALLKSTDGWSVQILAGETGSYRIYLDKKYSAHTVSELNDFISKKLWSYDESQQVPDEKFDKAFAQQEKVNPDETCYTADLAYSGFWAGLIRVNGEIDEHDFLVVSILSRNVFEAALDVLHRSYRAVKAAPEIAEAAMPSKLSLKGTNFNSPYATAYVIKRDNAWISANGMIQQLNDLITREASNFGVAYTRRLQDRGGSNGPVWYRSVEAAKFFMELNVEPVAPKPEQPKTAGKPRKWIEFAGGEAVRRQGDLRHNFAVDAVARQGRGRRVHEGQDALSIISGKIFDKGDPNPYFPDSVGYGFLLRFNQSMRLQAAWEKASGIIDKARIECSPSWLTAHGGALDFYKFTPDRDSDDCEPAVKKSLLYVKVLPGCAEWPSESVAKLTRDACLRKIMETFGAAMDVIEPSSGPKKPEAKRAVWGAGSGSLFEDAG